MPATATHAVGRTSATPAAPAAAATGGPEVCPQCGGTGEEEYWVEAAGDDAAGPCGRCAFVDLSDPVEAARIEQAEAAMGAIRADRTTVACWECRGRGTERVEEKFGQWFAVPCVLCCGTGRVGTYPEPRPIVGRPGPRGKGGRLGSLPQVDPVVVAQRWLFRVA